MECFYAQIGKDGVVAGISRLSGEVDAPHMVRIDSYDIDLMGKKYENGGFYEAAEETGKVGD